MINIDLQEISGWKPAIMGMRNPMNSWRFSDSTYDPIHMGENDHDLAIRLVDGGPVHAKFRRMITVYVDILAPLYWWKEFDTYKVGTVANSTSTMHKIMAKEFEVDDFSHEKLGAAGINHLREIIEFLNIRRREYIEYTVKNETTLAKACWWDVIQILPTSFNQLRTVELNYEVLSNIYQWRKNHKLDEWREFCDWIMTLPYSELIIGKRRTSECFN